MLCTSDSEELTEEVSIKCIFAIEALNADFTEEDISKGIASLNTKGSTLTSCMLQN